MTVLGALRELDRAWVGAVEPATMLERALSQDHPGAGADAVPKAVSELTDPAVDVAALLEAGAARLHAVLDTDGDGEPEPAGAVGAVDFLQQRRLELGAGLARLTRAQTLIELHGLARRRDRADGGREWLEWWSVVMRSIDDLPAAVAPIDAALAACWRELAERPQVRLGDASVGRLTVREARRPIPPPDAPRPTPLRPVPVAARTGDT